MQVTVVLEFAVSTVAAIQAAMTAMMLQTTPFLPT